MKTGDKQSLTKSTRKNFIVTKYTTARGLRSMRCLARARSFKLFEDQYDTLEALKAEHNVEFNISDVIRDGLDLAIEDIRKKLCE